MNDQPLKPCPFCGGDAVVEDCGNHEEEWGGPWEAWIVECPKCDIYMGTEDMSKAGAISKWNTRAYENQTLP